MSQPVTSGRRHPGPANSHWKGGRHLSRGYVLLWDPSHPSATAHGYVLEHVAKVERALGKRLPAGAEIHHVNERRDDNNNGNLVVCGDNGYHRYLHSRTRVLKAGGHPAIDKICQRCRRMLPKSDFSKCRARYDGFSNICRACAAHQNAHYKSIAKAGRERKQA